MEPDDVDNAFETPIDNPLYPHFLLEMRNVEILTAFYRTDLTAARRLIPPPLELAGDVVIVHVYHMHDADSFGDYYESAVQLPVTLPGQDLTGARQTQGRAVFGVKHPRVARFGRKQDQRA
jgi:acetoacetate decarboxylase